MDIEIRKLTDTYIRFVISGVNYAFVNTLRRVLIAEIPKMAIEDVEFHLGSIRDEEGKEYESITPLFDEVIAHRLGMVPIPTDLDLFVPKDKCKCGGEGCPNCIIMYTLNKKGPCTVYSGDLESIGDPRFAVVDKSIPIVKLQEGQAVLIYATAILGTGAQHAKWQVTSGVGYKNYPKIEINDKLCDHRGECVKACPKGVLILKNKRVVIENIEDCSLCKACEEVCHPPRTKGRKKRTAIRVTPEDTKFIFQFETDGSLTASQTLRYALSLLSDKFSTFSEQIGELSRSK